MKKILFLSGSLSAGGSERQMVTVARLLKENGYAVELACFVKNDFYAHLLEEKNIKINWLLANNSINRIIKIRRFIRKGDFDVVISFLEAPNFINNLSAIGGKKWKIITGERSAKEATFVSIKGKLFAWFQKFSDIIVCNSNNAKKMWEEYFPEYKNKLTTIYNNVNLAQITSEYIPKENNKINIVVAATIRDVKNPIGFIHALALLNKKQRDKVKVNWYGIGFREDDIRTYNQALNLIKENHLEDVIYLHEKTKEIANKMNESDVIALFSKVEGLPNAICEGMMIGKPIIMSKVSDYSVLVDKTNGFLCDWDDEYSIKEALVSAISLTKEQLLEMGKYSRNKANKLFSPKVIAGKWIHIIEN